MHSNGPHEASSTRHSTPARKPLAQPARACARCGVSIVDYRRQAIYCGGPCRAAASRAKRLADSAGDQILALREETARNRTHESSVAE